ncbi:conserved hypothetical protein, partial [Trichinella spiralis]|uniref:hypothetical protein n=1 Tax=Trichinella spiralis TaxID=6334 RepID=UPI0001EFD072
MPTVKRLLLLVEKRTTARAVGGGIHWRGKIVGTRQNFTTVGQNVRLSWWISSNAAQLLYRRLATQTGRCGRRQQFVDRGPTAAVPFGNFVQVCAETEHRPPGSAGAGRGTVIPETGAGLEERWGTNPKHRCNRTWPTTVWSHCRRCCESGHASWPVRCTLLPTYLCMRLMRQHMRITIANNPE